MLQGTPGSVAYIAVSYLIAHQLPAVAIQNTAGKFEYPNLSNIENAARPVKHVPAQRRAEHRQPAQEREDRVPDLHVHLRDRPDDAPRRVPC